MAITLKSTFAVLVSAMTLAACTTNTSGTTALAGAIRLRLVWKAKWRLTAVSLSAVR